MSSVNKVIILGNLGKDPEVRKTASGQSVTTLTIATTDRYISKSGESQEKTEWHSVVLWARLADLAGQYLRKGRSVYIEGRLETRSWDDRDGQKRYKTEIVASDMKFIGPKPEGSGNYAPSAAMAGAAASGGYSKSTPPAAEPPYPDYDFNQAPPPAGGGFEDDLPF